MAPFVYESDVKATPATIWKACFAEMKFEKWDPDVEKLEEISGECVNGTTFFFVMKEGPVKKIPCELSDVKENERLIFSGKAMTGLMKFSGLVEITTKDTINSHIKYSFTMEGMVGNILAKLKPAVMEKGTEKGLENMVKLSEEAQRNENE